MISSESKLMLSVTLTIKTKYELYQQDSMQTYKSFVSVFRIVCNSDIFKKYKMITL